MPLHLSYRIFETSSKRLKLSEDNENYKKSLMDAGIDSIELKDEKSLKREWKEVQLKISETGVMSITDISSPIHKKEPGIENVQDEKTSGGETVTSIAEINTVDSVKIENCSISKSSVEMMPSTLIIDAQMTKNPIFSDSSNAFLVTNDIKFTSDNLSSNSNCMALTNQHNGTATRQTNETRNCTASAKLQQDAQEVKMHNQSIKVEDQSETVSQGQKSLGHSVTQLTDEKVGVNEDTEKMDAHAKKMSINNNNNNADFQAGTQECIKSSNETKMGNAGSKIDALSAKLQFQPKMGQVNNTYSKRAPKEKRGSTVQQSTKKSDVKSSTEDTKVTDTKTQANCGNVTGKVSVSTATPSQKSAAPAVASQNTSDSSSGCDKQKDEKDNQSINIDLQQALHLLEQRNSPVQASTGTESVPRTSHVASMVNQRVQNSNTAAMNEDIASTAPSVSTSAISQTTSTFPYNTLHDIVTSVALTSTAYLKSSSGIPQKLLGTSPIACPTSNNQMAPMPQQFNVQTSPINVYSIPTSLKNNYASQDVATVTAMSTATITTTAMSKPMSTGVCPIPPCPDAIPISLMKQMSMRKQDVTAKGTNLNEICAKIGSNTIGSKINDICAKIGENSKEKNRMDSHGKTDVPDLLRINAKKNPAPLLSNTEAAIKHIPNIPNVPVYTPSSNAATMENKSGKLVLPTSTSASALAVSTSSAPASAHATQRLAPLRKQSQSVGYKTLRDPPKSWNPTLSKNNYIAAKNQAKEMQNQTQTSMSEGTNKQIPSKPAKIFKMRNMLRYLGNPVSGVKPMYGVTNDSKEKEQSTTNVKSATLNMMKIDPKTLSPIVSTINSPIVSPPPYSPNARSYQNTPFSRDICRNTGSPISPRNSPVNMLSTNPFIPSPTPNTNPRIIYPHFSPFPDTSRFPNPLIRSPIGIPSAFHSSLPPSINKLYQRSSYIPQTTGYAPVVGQPPTVQRIPPSTHSSSPKSPKASSPSSISSTSFNLGKAESQSPITSTVDNVALLLSKSVTAPVSVPLPLPVPVPVSVALQRELNAFNLSKTGGLSPSPTANVVKASPVNNADAEAQLVKPNSSMSLNLPASTASAETPENSSAPNERASERKQGKETEGRKAQETTRCKEDNSKAKVTETKCSSETADNAASLHDKREKNQAAKINGDVTTEQFASKKSKEDGSSNETATTTAETSERDSQVERSTSKERNSIPKNNTQANINDSPANDSKNEDLGKSGEQIQGNKSEVQKNKAET